MSQAVKVPSEKLTVQLAPMVAGLTLPELV